MNEGEREKLGAMPATGNRTIDRIRDSGGMIEVGSDADGPVTGMIPLLEIAYLLKPKAIYLLRMADQIDPGRENKNIPNSVQLVLAAGSESDLVARTLLTADRLFRKGFVNENERNTLISTVFDILRNLQEAQEMADTLQSDIEKLSQPVKIKGMAANLPAAGSVETRAVAFIQRIHSIVQQLYDLPRPFVEFPAKGWPDNFTEALRQKFGDDHLFTKFSVSVTSLVKFIRNARHCIEHKSVDKRIEVFDFHIDKSGLVNRPSIEIVHAETPLNKTDLLHFMLEIINRTSEIVESMIVEVADIIRPEKAGSFILAISHIPEDQRRNGSRVRFGYFIKIGEGWSLLG